MRLEGLEGLEGLEDLEGLEGLGVTDPFMLATKWLGRHRH